MLNFSVVTCTCTVLRQGETAHLRSSWAQVQTMIQVIMDTQPNGSAGARDMSRKETVDRIAQDLYGKARRVT